MTKRKSLIFGCNCVQIICYLLVFCLISAVELDDTHDYDLEIKKQVNVQKEENEASTLSVSSAQYQFPNENEQNIMKRRRPVRKRKRRPFLSSNNEQRYLTLENEEQSRYFGENFEQNDDSSNRFVTNERHLEDRRNVTNKNLENYSLSSNIENFNDEMIDESPKPSRKYNRRRQYPKFNNNNEKDEIKSGNIDLKKLLKQTKTMSLSEFLQQQNLSLADLLKGEESALLALKQTNKNEFDESNEKNNDKNKIFVPSHPKFYTSVDFNKPIIIDDINDEAKKDNEIVSPNIVMENNKNEAENKKEKLKSGENDKNVNVDREESIFSAFNSNNFKKEVRKNYFQNEKQMKQDEITSVSDAGPIKIPIFLEPVSPTTKTFEKMREQSAREELQELFSESPEMKKNLTKILQDRNMTLEEFFVQRDKGSSQRHLSEVFSARKPKQMSEINIQIDNQNVALQKQSSNDNKIKPDNIFDSFPNFHLQKRSQGQENKLLDYFKQEAIEQQTQKSFKLEKDLKNNQNFPIRNLQSLNNLKEAENLLFETFPNFNFSINNKFDQNNEIITIEDLLQIQNDDSTISDSIDLNIKNQTKDKISPILIASSSIILISSLVFCSIFLVFKFISSSKLSSKKKLISKPNISNRTPILDDFQRRKFFTKISSSLGRKNYFNYTASKNDLDWHQNNDKKLDYF